MEQIVKINGRQLKLTNLDKLFWKDEGFTKGDLIAYYSNISKYILPYLKDRPESLNRHPNGINGPAFFQKDVRGEVPSWIKTQDIYSESNNKDILYMVCNNEATLIYMANLGCIEINPWFSRVKKLDNPDYIAIDLDPLNISFERVIETALAVKQILDEAGAKAYCKTSGATGIHIYVPLGAKYDFDLGKQFALVIATMANQLVPDITSLERSPSKRDQRVYIDYLQNRRGQTLAAPYSVRPKPGATVSTPLKWNELKKGLSPKNFTIKNILKRLEKEGDLFSPVLKEKNNIEKCLKKLGA